MFWLLEHQGQRFGCSESCETIAFVSAVGMLGQIQVRQNAVLNKVGSQLLLGQLISARRTGNRCLAYTNPNKVNVDSCKGRLLADKGEEGHLPHVQKYTLHERQIQASATSSSTLSLLLVSVAQPNDDNVWRCRRSLLGD